MNLRPNFNSITTRLIFWGFLLFIAGTLSRMYLLSDYMHDDLKELTSHQLQSMADYVAKDVDKNIVAQRKLLEQCAVTFPQTLQLDRKQLQSWLTERYDINPQFSLGMIVLSPTGIALADYPILPGRVGTSYADRDYFQQVMRGKFTFGRPVIGRVSKVPVLPMAMPLFDSSGNVRAVLLGISALSPPGFMDALYTSRVGETGGLWLISPGDKFVVGSSDSNITFKPIPHAGVNLLLDQAMNGERGGGIAVNEASVEELSATASVPSIGWLVVAHTPSAEVFAPITHWQHFSAIHAAYMGPLLLLVIVFGLRYLLRPLIEAAKHADRMTKNEIPFEPLPIVRDDEVGHLTLAFNRVLSKLIESRAELQHLAHHDPLTGLPNRQLLTDRMQQTFARAQRSNGLVALLFLDLDGFKPINDQLGHDAGDSALREVASRLRSVVRSEDTLARVGGDEFVILLSDLDENALDTAKLVADKCLNIFQQPFIICEQARNLGTSIGIAMGDCTCSTDVLLVAADRAMYRAKESGRGKFFISEDCRARMSPNRQSSCGLDG